MTQQKAKFFRGQSIRHRLFKYHGVVVGVDPRFQSTDEWYEEMARSRPPKDQPWYHVVDHQGTRRYVAERNLEPDPSMNN